jgi:predicted HicB family RNase H-like nuclease
MKASETLTKKVTARLNEKQYRILVKNAKASKMNLAEYVRACIL